MGSADAYLHMADLPETDILASDVFAEHQGGFAAAAAALGSAPALYHGDATRPDALRIRTLPEEIARVLRARATNPRWIAGQMRHGYRGAAEIAETVDSLFAFAATSDAVPSRHFDLMFDATLGDEAVRAFLTEHNPAAARAIAEKFNEAAARGFWVSRRNSTAAILAALEAAAVSALAPARVGWCPGALAPMASGDGLIVRVKPRGGRLSLGAGAGHRARVAAATAMARWTSPRRANLQIRGLDEAGLGTATAILDDAGLLDADAGGRGGPQCRV